MELKHASLSSLIILIILLIVPYGIETVFGWYQGLKASDPYGIETIELENALSGLFAFNRTLWN